MNIKEEFKNVTEIINSLRSTTKSTEKTNILKSNKDNELLKKVLYYVNNPYLKFKITQKTFEDYNSTESSTQDIFTLLDTLASSNINDYLKNEAVGFVNKQQDEELRDLYKCMLIKDLKCNLGVKTINKVFNNLIPSFGCQLAESIFRNDNIEKVKGKEFSITTKLDGMRCLVLKNNGRVEFYSRQGQQIEGLVELEEDLKDMPNNIVLDGELLIKEIPEGVTTNEAYRMSMKIARKKGVKRNLCLNVFDLIDRASFDKGVDTTPHKERRNKLKEFISNNNFEFLKLVDDLYIGKDIDMIYKLLDEAREKGEEGIMVSLSSGVYENKRVKQLLKVKVMKTMDLLCRAVYEGEGEFENMLGGIVTELEVNGVIYLNRCGSGFKLEERQKIWDNPECIIGKIVEIQYFEITQNENGDFGLRFPVFKEIRTDKIEPSYD